MFVALNLKDGRFAAGTRWTDQFSFGNGGWDDTLYPRHVADVDGNGKADVIGFGHAGVYLGAGGWTNELYPRLVVDLNANGRSDIVGFGHDGLWASLSAGDTFAEPTLLARAMAFGAGGWTTTRHVRIAGDFDGDGTPDLVGFGDDGVYVIYP